MYKLLPNPVKYSTMSYISCAIGYNVIGTYYDSKSHLIKFRKNAFDDNNIFLKGIKTDLDAVQYGAQVHFWNRLLNSFIWPVTIMKNIIPFFVLGMNPPPKKD